MTDQGPVTHEVPCYEEFAVPGTPFLVYHDGDEESSVQVCSDGYLKLGSTSGDWQFRPAWTIAPGELTLRQKFTYLAVAVRFNATGREPLDANRLSLMIDEVLTGDLDPRGWVQGLHTVQRGHVGVNGKVVA